MMGDLHRLFSELRAAVPDGPPDEVDFLFKHENLPQVPPQLTSARVHLRKIARDYPGTRCANTSWRATRASVAWPR